MNLYGCSFTKLVCSYIQQRMARIMKLVLLLVMLVVVQSVPTTLDGPFKPTTVPFDNSLRQGSQDLPSTDPRVARHRPQAFPEQISLALSSPDAIWVSWVSGDSQMGEQVVPLDPSRTSSIVKYGTKKGAPDLSATGSTVVYSQLYPFQGLLNYASGLIHHVRLEGLRPATTYYYRCGSSSTTMSEELQFTTLPNPSATDYPERVAVVGDLGLTFNSSTTLEHVVQNNPSLLLMVGDLTYADQYNTNGTGSSCFSCSNPDAPIRETYQPRWDEWGRFMERLTSTVPMMVIEGNHEIEPQASGKTFESYNARFAVPSQESGSNTKLYYSFDAGGIHFIMLGGYVDYNKTGPQSRWLMHDLERINRSTTPWVVAAWHPPWYNSYSSHYQEAECMRLEMEDALYRFGVDIVFSGHVHAYERMNRVYNYELDPCGPVYITVGDGGNIEKVDTEHADDPGSCPKPADNVPQFGGVCASDFTSGPAAGKFCWNRQPEWSALRDGSFGHGILEVKNSTHALWTWYRNQDAYGENHLGDEIYIVRQPELCNIKCIDTPPSATESRSNASTLSQGIKCLALLLLSLFLL